MDATQSVEQVRWNLTDLVAGAGEDPVSALLDDALERADAFAQRYRGALATIDGGTLVAAMTQLAAIYDLVGRAGSYASLRLRHRHDRPGAGRPGA